jgi:acetyl esterase/lipase
MSHNRRASAITLLSCLAVLLSGVTLPAVRAAAPPPSTRKGPKVPAGVAYLPDLVYGSGGKEKLLLDLAQPRKGTGRFAAVLVLHGGAWITGNRKSCVPIALELARHGYLAVSASYRLAPVYRYPAHIHDAKCAVRWLRANAARYRIDPNRIAVLGYSAGGHLACLLGTTAGHRHLEGTGGHAGHSSKVQLVVAYYPVTDLCRLCKSFLHTLVVESFLGSSARACARASPITHADRRSAPTLLIHGTADLLVPFAQSEVFARKLRETGAHVQLHTIHKAGHGFGCGPGEHDREADRTALEFLNRHFTPRVCPLAQTQRP